VFNVEDQLTREGLVTEIDTSPPGLRVARTLDRLVADRGKPAMIVSDNVLRQEIERWAWQQVSVH
jgi:putative transposase